MIGSLAGLAVALSAVVVVGLVEGQDRRPKQLALAAGTPRRSPSGPTYPTDRSVSPITQAVARRVREIAARNPNLHDDRFAKVGASATVNRNYLRCLAGDRVRLGAHARLAPTVAHFNRATANPFLRTSLAAVEGWHAGRAIWGSPSPLARELRASDARFAVVMYGTNDLELGRPALYGRLMWRLTRMLTVRGVVPILSTIMPRDDDPEADRYVTLYNAVVRAVAQQARVPLIDYHRELLPLPRHGLASDGVHPNVRFVNGAPRACDFTPAGLRHGYNVRNLLTLRGLAAARGALDGTIEPEPPLPSPAGEGTFDDPIEIALPFAGAGDTSRAASSARSAYPACGDQAEGGPEVVYRLRLDEPATVFALATSDHGADVDLHRLGPDGRCVERADEGLEMVLPAGEHLLVVDTFERGGAALAGRYTLAVARVDRPSDRRLEPTR